MTGQDYVVFLVLERTGQHLFPREVQERWVDPTTSAYSVPRIRRALNRAEVYGWVTRRVVGHGLGTAHRFHLTDKGKQAMQEFRKSHGWDLEDRMADYTAKPKIQNPAHREAQPAAEKGRADGSEAFPGLFDAFD